MALQYTDPFNATTHIVGIGIRKLQVNSDERGNLVETLKIDWTDLYDEEKLPFRQNYYSITHAGVARDETQWHLHQHQRDRFIVIDGDLVVGVHDPRENSTTKDVINLFKMGSMQGPDGQYALMIPEQVHHGFVVAPAGRAILTNFPSKLYDPKDEGRIPFDDVRARLSDGRPFSWDAIRDDLR